MAVRGIWSTLHAYWRSKCGSQGVGSKVAVNASWLMADKVLRMGVGLAVTIWLARYLGPEEFGALNYALAFVAIFAAVSGLGLDGIVVRNLVATPAHQVEIVGTTLVLKAMGGLVSFLLAIGAIAVVRPEVWWLVAVVAAATIFKAFDAIDLWFQARVESKQVVIARGSAFLAVALFRIVLIILTATLAAFAWVVLLEAALVAMGLMVIYRKAGGLINYAQVTWHCSKKLLRDSWPLILSAILVMLYMRIDQVMLGEMVGDSQVGTYSMAVRFAEVWVLLPGAIISSYFPGVVEARRVSEEHFRARLQRLYSIVAFIGYAVAIPTTFLATWLVGFLLGPAYAEAGPMLVVLTWAIFFAGMGMARSSFLNAMNWTRVHFVAVLLGCVLNILLNFALIPGFGGMGAAAASLISYWFAAHGTCFLWQPLRPTGWMMARAMACPRVW